MTEQPSLDVVRRQMIAHGVARLYVKFLSPNDNSKNQVYLGGGFGILNVLPAGSVIATTSGSHKTPIFQARFALKWLDELGAVHPAPEAKLILYPQYPEVRMSGYLRGASWAPSDIMGNVRDAGRLLLLGVSNHTTIIGLALPPNSPVARELVSLDQLEPEGVLFRVPLKHGENREQELLRALCAISQRKWVPSMRLDRDHQRVPCGAPNCGGYTLEALLNITPNGRSEPDYLGWEVKSFRVSNLAKSVGGPVTLMTPEPTAGFYREQGVAEFVRKFGYADKLGRPNRRNFGGIHRVAERCTATGLTMQLDGFDSDVGKITAADGRIALVSDKDVVAAAWGFPELLAHWSRKHAATVFVPTVRRTDDGYSYQYGSRVSLGTGADFLRVLAGFSTGEVYYDPGIKLMTGEQVETTKRRSQFRVQFKNLPALYERFRQVEACVTALGVESQSSRTLEEPS